MSEQSTTRRKFLKLVGLSAGASIASQSVLAGMIDHREIHRLNADQQEFMIRYGKWMDDFIDVIRVQKAEPANMENHMQMIKLTDAAAEWQTQLTEFMKDETFSLIYNASIERMKREI